MTEKTTAVVNQEAIDEARKLSGEANNVKFDFTPLIEIDNSKVEEELSGGRKTKVLVEPRFIFTTKNEKNEYIKTPYTNAIKGSVLKVRYMVEKKWEENSQTPYWRSNEFDSFRGQNVILKSSEASTPAYTYKYFEELYKKKYNLWTLVYFLIKNEEGEGKVFKLKIKGVSRGNFWDYMATFGNNDSITVHETEVSFEVDDTAENPFNYMCFEKTKNQINVEESLKFGRELRDALNAFSSPAAPAVEPAKDDVLPVKTEPFGGITLSADPNPPSPPTLQDQPAPEVKKEEEKKPMDINSFMGNKGAKVVENKTEADDEIKVDKIPF